MPKIRQARTNKRKKARNAIRHAKLNKIIEDASAAKTVAALRRQVVKLAKIVETLVQQEQETTANEKH